jgi:hypothetical protein
VTVEVAEVFHHLPSAYQSMSIGIAHLTVDVAEHALFYSFNYIYYYCDVNIILERGILYRVIMSKESFVVFFL